MCVFYKHIYAMLKHTNTGVTPSKMMKPSEQPAYKYLSEMEHGFHLVHEYSREHLRQASEVQKHYYDMQTYGKTIQSRRCGSVIQAFKTSWKITKSAVFLERPFCSYKKK